jgi:hypothetical protein
VSNFFDPKGFAAGGFLDGQVADIVGVKATKFDYNGTVDPPANVIEIEILRADGKTRTEVYSTGKAAPTEDGNNVDQALNNQCKAASLFGALAATKFPLKTLGTEGLSALKGQRFIWKNVGKSGKDVFVPATYVGVAEGDAKAVAAQQDEVRDLVGTLVLTIVKSAGEAGIKKSALTQRIGQNLANDPNKAQAISLVMSDSFLSSVPGVNVEKGVLTLIEG